MRRIAIVLVLILGSCASDGNRPSNIDNACVIKQPPQRRFSSQFSFQVSW